MELIRQVYPKLGVVPGLLLAPGWSQDSEVGIALAAKAANINGVFKAMAILDLDTTTATKHTDVKEIKENKRLHFGILLPAVAFLQGGGLHSCRKRRGGSH